MIAAIQGASAGPAEPERSDELHGTGAQAGIWQAVRNEVASARDGARRTAGPDDARAPLGQANGGPMDRVAAVVSAGEDHTVHYAASSAEAVDMVRSHIDSGAAAVAVIPVALSVGDGMAALPDPDLLSLHRDLHVVARAHPGVDIQYVGPPFDDAPALEAALAALRPAGSDEPALLAAAVDRAFEGDLDRFGRFIGALNAGLPPHTRIVLRGSAVQGSSYETGQPFDARGPGTSDLDLVVLGDEAMAAWDPDAFYLAGVNTRPLCDAEPDIATSELERARRAAQEVARRPVAIQAMARWFLDLRSGLQGTPYVVLGG